LEPSVNAKQKGKKKDTKKKKVLSSFQWLKFDTDEPNSEEGRMTMKMKMTTTLAQRH